MDLNALLHNVGVIRERTDAQLYAVVKANAYGHGMAIAGFLQPYVDGFCVATPDEARELVSLAVYKPVIIMGAISQSSGLLPYGNVVYTACSLDDLKRICALDRKKPFYLKLNTGMNRLGFDIEKTEEIMCYVRHKSLNCLGIYTHFFCPSERKTVLEQYKLLQQSFNSIGDATFGMHCCASNFSLLSGDFHNDIVRVGISLYGYGSEGLRLKPAMKIGAPIVEIRNIRAGSYVGYGLNRIESDATVAVVRIGYGDGYRRVGHKKRFVSVKGVLCPVVGQICMDMCMVDVSGVDVKIGDCVWVLGEGATAQMLADDYGTIVYEVLTSFNERIERVYVYGESSAQKNNAR